jgi:large subunit ribosomal protein L22
MATPAQPLVTAAIEGHAIARHVKLSPQKARLVMDLIRGQRAEDAVQILRFTKKRAAPIIEKVLSSAIANAQFKADEASESLDVDHLVVSECFVNEGARWKRIRPAPFGRAYRYQKRTAHLIVKVAEHRTAAAERASRAAAEKAREKGVAGAVKRVRRALTGAAKAPRKKK